MHIHMLAGLRDQAHAALRVVPGVVVVDREILDVERLPALRSEVLLPTRPSKPRRDVPGLLAGVVVFCVLLLFLLCCFWFVVVVFSFLCFVVFGCLFSWGCICFSAVRHDGSDVVAAAQHMRVVRRHSISGSCTSARHRVQGVQGGQGCRFLPKRLRSHAL